VVDTLPQAGPGGAHLAELSKATFIDAMERSAPVLGALVAASAVLIGLYAPGRDDRQLGFVRRLRDRDAGGRHCG
jgi:hypothetical protein